MQRHWNDQELETYWSFSSDELALIPNRDASSRLGVAASLKFLQLEGCFPSSAKDIPSVAIDHMATLLDADPKTIADYDWQGRTGTRYRRCLRTRAVKKLEYSFVEGVTHQPSSNFRLACGMR